MGPAKSTPGGREQTEFPMVSLDGTLSSGVVQVVNFCKKAIKPALKRSDLRHWLAEAEVGRLSSTGPSLLTEGLGPGNGSRCPGGRGVRALRDLCEQAVGVLFLVKRLLQDRDVGRQAELLRPVAGAAVGSDFVVFHLLGGGNEAGITHRARFSFLGNVLARSHDSCEDGVL